MINNKQYDFSIATLGTPTYASPIKLSNTYGDSIINYTREDEKVQYTIEINKDNPLDTSEYNFLEKAGPREKIFFSPEQSHAAIITCGGLCPGLNDVIRSVVRTLWENYGVKNITGIKYGYNGLLDKYEDSFIKLTRESVDSIHTVGGSFLGTSRGGGEEIEKIVDALQQRSIDIIFIIGGDGTQKGASRIAKEALKRGYQLSVIGIPKTIDNDLAFIERTFGFETAVAKATESVLAAHQEAESVFNGIGLVKLMGRNSGFIAAYAALASHEANFVLVPEVPFDLYGHNGFLEHLKNRLKKRQHAVVVVAEGAGMELFDELPRDDSGNISFSSPQAPDIGTFLIERINSYFSELLMDVSLKYISPSYIIRSATALPTDALYCTRLASNAVHAGMAGRTNMMISFLHNRYVHLPIDIAVSEVNVIDPESPLWLDVIGKLQMPIKMVN